MKVFKFGGASIKNADAVKNIGNILQLYKGPLVVVISAMGKTTNALERVVNAHVNGDKAKAKFELDQIRDYHISIVENLVQYPDHALLTELSTIFSGLYSTLGENPTSYYNMAYDQMVSWGEILSTIIVSSYLNSAGLNNEWVDIRQYLKTDGAFREGRVDWKMTTNLIRQRFRFDNTDLYITQGFIGSTVNNITTTLGREGSDYTAAVLASILEADSVTVWKDVPGILNADPKWLSEARKLEEISYREAVEMTFSGAKVIHPKTIKPLQNKNIPLYVKSFLEPEEKGTLVTADPTLRKIMPVFIRKANQILISFLPKDFSFVMGDNLSRIFHLFMGHGIKVNLVEASAVSIDVCVDDERVKVDALLETLKDEYSALYNENVEMLSVRHYTPEAVERITTGREILLEQRTRSTVRFVVRKA